MPKKQYKVIAPVVVEGKRRSAGENITADADEVEFLVRVGALLATAKTEPKTKNVGSSAQK